MRSRTALRTAVATATLALALTGTGIAAAAPAAEPIRHGHHQPGSGLLSGSASGSAATGSAAAGSAARGSAEIAACLLVEAVVPLPICLLLA